METMKQLFERDAGILMHVSSLPSKYGVGDFGTSSLQWIEGLAGAKQNLWQILPLNPAGYGDSPYQGLSAFAANPIFLSPDHLHSCGLLDADELSALCLADDKQVNYAVAYANRMEMSCRAADRFFKLNSGHKLRVAYEAFRINESEWLEDFAVFIALKNEHGGLAWTEWPAAYRDRQAEALNHFKQKSATELDRIRLEQFLLREQWEHVRALATEHGVRIIGDLPIFVAHDSADVWCQPELFRLNQDGSPSVVAGVPPDYFSETGQLWGNPLYRWEAHQADGFAWWRARLRKMLEWVDIVRIDHFRGFAACWEIPGDAETAVDGHWIQTPGKELFEYFARDCDMPLPVIAEDLGVITDDVVALRDGFHLPGIRIEQFAFGNDAMKHTFIPEAYDTNCAAYTGTHDNDTVVGWFNSVAYAHSTRTQTQIEHERTEALEYFGSDGSMIHWDFIRGLYASNAGAAIVPLQDILGLGSEARMNTPGTASGCWRWRLSQNASLDEAFRDLALLSAETRRGLANIPVINSTI